MSASDVAVGDLPCPFCGRPGRRYTIFGVTRVICYGDDARDHKPISMLARQWNQRTTSDETARLRERNVVLVAALKRARNVLEQVTPEGFALEAVNAALQSQEPK